MVDVALDLDPIDVDPDGICEAQTLGGAGSLTLDGALCDLGTAGQFDISDAGYSSGCAGVQIGFASTGNLSGVTFTVTGKDQDGVARTEAVTGPNNNTVEGSTYWSQITDIAASGAVGTNVTVGTVDEIITKTIPLNRRLNYACEYAVTGLSGTCQFDIQESLTSLKADTDPSTLLWSTSQSNKTANLQASGTLYASAIQLVFDSYSSGAELQFSVAQADW